MANIELQRRFLELAGFEGSQIDEFLDDWLYTIEKVGLTDEDVRYATEEYIPENWDVQYRGVRKMIGAYIRELAEIVKTTKYKEEGKKLIYGILPAVQIAYTGYKYAGGDNVYVSFPDLLLVDILNGFFHKAAPWLNYAEDLGFTYGCRHCPLNKMRVSAFAKGLIAAPDVIWSWGLNCDEGPKTDEMIQCMLGEEWKYVISRIPHDTYLNERDDEYDRVKYLAGVLQEGMNEISEATGIYPSEEDMKRAIDDFGRYQFKVGTLVGLVCKSDPVPLGGNSLTQFEQVVGVPFNSGYKYIEEAIDILIKELRKVVKEGKGILPKGAPKVGSYFVPFCIPWIDRLFRENGVATTFSQTLTPTRNQMAPARFTDNPYMSIAESWLKMPIGQNMGYEAAQMVEKVEAYKPDGMLMGFFDFDRWLGGHHKMCSQIVEKETGVPHYYIEADFWDDRDYSEEALRTRIESIAQMLYMRKEMEG